MDQDGLIGKGNGRYTYENILVTARNMLNENSRSNFANVNGEVYTPSVYQYTTGSNLANMKAEILGAIKKRLNPLAKARQLYIELGKRVSYDYQYYYDMDSKIPTRELAASRYYDTNLSFDTLTSDAVICKGWSELYRELLISSGFDPNDVKIKGGNHRWVEIDLHSEGIVIADATDAINHSNDLANAKMGAPLVNFVLLPQNYSGSRLSNIAKSEDGLNNLLDRSLNSWRDVDKKNGYQESKANQFYEQLNFNPNMSGFEAKTYMEKISRSILGETEAKKNIKYYKCYYNQNGRISDCVAMVSNVDGIGYYMLYGKPIGKLVFNSESELLSYIRKGGFE